ncbi:MAG: efflux RND transporter periplasmic adaptor subunit, partial [Myxococcota bacterium]
MNRTSVSPLFLVLPLAVMGCPEEQKPSEPIIRSVHYVVVESTEERKERTFSGSLAAGNQSQLSFQVSGRIRKLPVRAGQRIKRGQLIGELDPTDFELQLREAKANATQARAQANNADANYQRIRRLYETRNTSRQDLDAARTQRDTARAANVAAAETVQRIKRQLEYTRLEAPAAGTINGVMAEANEVVTAGKPIVVLQAGKALEASVDVPESFVRMISIGDSAKVAIGALSTTVDGVVQEIGVSAQGAGVFPVTVKLSSDPQNARPGMVAEVILTPPKDAVVIPEGFKLPL